MVKTLAGTNLFNGFSPENILEAFLAGTNDGFMILSGDFRVLSFNDKYNNYHHLHSGNYLENGVGIEHLIAGGANNEMMHYLRRAMEGEIIKYVLRYPTLHGRNTWYDIEYYPLKSKLGEIIGVGVGAFETTERHETEEKLKRSEDLFKTLIQNSTDAFQLTDKDFKLLFVSTTILNILGFTADELLGINGMSMVHPEERAQVDAWFKKVRSHHEKLFSIEYRVKNKAGHWIWIENYASNLLDNKNVEAVVMNLRNIQAKKMADFALIQAEHRLSLLLNNTEESFIILNNRLKIISYNQAAQQHAPYFYTRDLQSGSSLLDFVTVAEIEPIIQLLERVFVGEQAERETSFIDAGNKAHIFSHSYRPLYDNAQEISGVFITSRNITTRKQAELQLKESEVRFKTIIQESFDAVLITNELTTIFYSSPSIKNVLGYTADELTATNLLQVIHPDDLQAATSKVAEVILSPHTEKNIDLRIQNSAGEWVWIELKGKNMFDNHYVQGILVSLRDITSRKKAEEIISLSEQRFKGLVQSGSDMIWIVDESSRLMYASPTVQTIMGINPVNTYGENLLELVCKDDREQLNTILTKLLQSGDRQVLAGPLRFINEKGQVFWIESTVTNLLHDPSIKGIVLNSKDVTERKKLTEELAANTERLKTAQKLARLGYFEYDFLTKRFFCSEEFYEIFEISNEETATLNFQAVEQMVHPDDRELVKRHIKEAIYNLADFNAEYRLITRQGIEKVILAIGAPVKSRNGRPEKLRVIMQDITDSKMALLALQNLEGRFKSLFDNSIDGVILSKPDGDIISANPAVCTMLGYTQKELTSLNRRDFVDVEATPIKQMLSSRSRNGSFVGEMMLRHKNGYLIPTEITSMETIDAQGQCSVSTIIRDFTEKKKIEEEQRSLTEELLRNNQDLQQFSFITSHNLRAPVANLISLLSLYNRNNPADDFNAVLVEKFEEATLQLNNTLNDLVNVLVIKSNNNIDREAIRFSEIFKGVKTNIEILLLEQKGIIEADFSEVDEIEYNRIHIDSIFLNLISNAIRYRSLQRSPHIKLRSYRQDNWVVVNFEDNGVGMDLKRYGDRLFGLYQRFHLSREGKGLGLYMTRSQIIAMGGKIEVESEPEKGTIFKVFFKS